MRNCVLYYDNNLLSLSLSLGEFYDQQFGGVGHQTLLGSSPTQMETSAYLPGYLLGGPGSPSPKSVSIYMYVMFVSDTYNENHEP